LLCLNLLATCFSPQSEANKIQQQHIIVIYTFIHGISVNNLINKNTYLSREEPAALVDTICTDTNKILSKRQHCEKLKKTCLAHLTTFKEREKLKEKNQHAQTWRQSQPADSAYKSGITGGNPRVLEMMTKCCLRLKFKKSKEIIINFEISTKNWRNDKTRFTPCN